CAEQRLRTDGAARGGAAGGRHQVQPRAGAWRRMDAEIRTAERGGCVIGAALVRALNKAGEWSWPPQIQIQRTIILVMSTWCGRGKAATRTGAPGPGRRPLERLLGVS